MFLIKRSSFVIHDRAVYQEEFEDTEVVIRIRRTDNTMAKRKTTNNDLQSITHKTKDGISRIQLKPGYKLRCSGRVGSSCSTSGTRRITLGSKIFL
jgi:hypothetical protein